MTLASKLYGNLPIQYNDYHQTGTEIQFTYYEPLVKLDKMQPRVSSLYVGHGQSVTLFNEEGFKGDDLLTIYGPKLVSFNEEYRDWNNSAYSAIYTFSFLNPVVGLSYETNDGRYGSVRKSSQEDDTTKHLIHEANKIQIQSGYDLHIYSEKDFIGRRMTIKGPVVVNMYQLGWNADESRRISSYQLKYTADKERPSSQISIYSGAPGQGVTINFDGQQNQEIIIDNLNEVFLDKRINSFILPDGWQLELNNDYNLYGESKTYTGPIVIAGDEFTKTASSLKLTNNKY